MELYEITHEQILSRFNGGYTSKSTIITATTDKDMAEKMLQIYLSNCHEGETYEINIIKENIKENNHE
jgi:hypothetical protein